MNINARTFPLSLQVSCKICVVMVNGLGVTEGLLLFGKESLLLCEGFTLSPAGDVCCRKHHPSRYLYTSANHGYSLTSAFHHLFASLSASVRDFFISTVLSEDLPAASCRRWLYEDIKEARFMRFLLEVRHLHTPR